MIENGLIETLQIPSATTSSVGGLSLATTIERMKGKREEKGEVEEEIESKEEEKEMKQEEMEKKPTLRRAKTRASPVGV